MKRSTILALFALVLAVGVSSPAFADDPTLHQVYEAAQAGNMADAQRMMDKVLADHPNSSKAHFVEAELLARQGRYAQAQSELATAERLEPGLPGEKPQAVSDLRARISQARASGSPVQGMVPVQPVRAGIPWGMILIVLAVVAFIVFVARAMGRRNAVVYGPGGAPLGGFGPGQPMQPYGGYPAGPMGGGMGGGLGSGIIGGLATGAALGAGVVAGEELMHHLTDRGSSDYVPPLRDAQSGDNMGGADFGVRDAGSWDDSSSGSSWDSGSSGGGDDWN
jgi:hypothetical protein